MKNLFLDDTRQPKNVTWVELPLVEWTIVKNYDEFVRHITTFGMPKRISLDNDLAEEHYIEYAVACQESRAFRYDKMKEKTGYCAAKWLVSYCMDRGEAFPEYYVHTMNHIARENIIQYIENYKSSLL